MRHDTNLKCRCGNHLVTGFDGEHPLYCEKCDMHFYIFELPRQNDERKIYFKCSANEYTENRNKLFTVVRSCDCSFLEYDTDKGSIYIGWRGRWPSESTAIRLVNSVEDVMYTGKKDNEMKIKELIMLFNDRVTSYIEILSYHDESPILCESISDFKRVSRYTDYKEFLVGEFWVDKDTLVIRTTCRS